MLGHLYVLKEEAAGHRHFKLADLWTFDDAQFRHLKFRVRADAAIHTDESSIHGIRKDEQRVFLCAIGTEQESIFRGMQQRLTVEEIAQQLSPEPEQDVEVRFHNFPFALF